MLLSELKSLSNWIALLKQETDCSICLHTLVSPVTTACHHTFCRACINPVLGENPSVCPLCKKKITRRGTTANNRIKELVRRVSVLVNAFKSESGVDLPSHCGDNGVKLIDNNNEEGTIGNNGLQGADIGTGCTHSGESRQTVTVSEDVTSSSKGAGKDGSVVEESGELASTLNESCTDIDHVSISQNVVNQHSAWIKPSNSLSISLGKLGNSPPKSQKMPEKKVKEWLNLNESIKMSPSVYTVKTNSPSNEYLKTADPDDIFYDNSTSPKCNDNDSSKLPCGKKYGKRVYEGARMSSHRARKLKKSIVLTKDEVEMFSTPEKEDAIPDSCPVEVNDTFDKLVNELKEKAGDESHCGKQNSTPEKYMPEQEKNDITLFESLPLPTDGGVFRKKKYTVSSNEDDGIIRKCGSKYESNYGRKRKFHSEGGVIDRIDKKGKTLEVIEGIDLAVERDDYPPFSPISGDNIEDINSQGKLGVNKKKGSHLSNENSPSKSLMPDVVDPAIGIKSTKKGERKRCSAINTTIASPGWSRLQSARKDFREKKKMGALPALNVSGGDPCLSSTTRQHSSRKTIELSGDDPPTSYLIIDDNGSSIGNQDAIKENPVIINTPVKGDRMDVDKQEASEQASSHLIPRKGSGASKHERVIKTPPSKLPELDISLQKADEFKTPFKVVKSDASNQKASGERFTLKAFKSDTSKNIESITVKSPEETDEVIALKQILTVPTALQKSVTSDVTEQASSPLKFHSRIGDVSQSNPDAIATSVNVTLESNKSGVRGSDECTDTKNSLSPKLGKGSHVGNLSLIDSGREIFEGGIHGQRDEGAASFTSCTKIKTLSNISNVNEISCSGSSRKLHRQKTLNPIMGERKTFSLDTSAKDLTELADLRVSTEDQLESLRTVGNANLPELLCNSPKINSFLQEKGCDPEGLSINRDIPRVGMELEMKNAKDFHTASVEKSSRKKSIHRKAKMFVPLFKMGPLNKKGVHSGRRVKFYVLGKLRHSRRTVKASNVGVDAALISQPKRLSNGNEAISKGNSDIGVQTFFSPQKAESGSPLKKSTRTVGSSPLRKSPFFLKHSSFVAQNFKSSRKPPSEELDSKYGTKDGKCVDSRYMSSGAKCTMTDTVQDPRLNLSLCEGSGLKQTFCARSRNVDREIPLSIVESSLDLIPDSDRSGFKVKGAQRFSCLRSHPKQKPLSRNLSTKKAVCQLFSNANGGLPEGEMAIPLACTQKSQVQEEVYFKTALASGSEEKDIIFLSSDSKSDHEGEEIEKNLKKMKNMQSQRKFKVERRNEVKMKVSPIPEECSSQNLAGATSSMHYVEELDSEEMDRKLKLIVANIEADMNIRKGKRNCDESHVDASASVKDDDVEIVEVPVDNESNSPTVVPETHPLALTCVEESESEHEPEKNNDWEDKEKDKEDKLEDNALKDSSLSLLKDCSGDESDFFVEGSQKDAEKLEKPIIVKKPPISLVTSGLQGFEILQVRRLVQMFNLQFSPQFRSEVNKMNAPQTTHVITKTDESGKTGCTFKYLCGVVTGCWIVSIHWVNDCLKAGKLLDEEPYEVLDDSGHCGPKLGRIATTKLFNGLEFICPEPHLETIEEIIVLGGGKVVSSVEGCSGIKSMRLAVVDSSAKENEEVFTRLAEKNVAVVTSDWIVESVGQCKLQPLIGYVVNLSPNAMTFSQHREILLSMGYKEEFLGNEDEQMELYMVDEEEEEEDMG